MARMPIPGQPPRICQLHRVDFPRQTKNPAHFPTHLCGQLEGAFVTWPDTSGRSAIHHETSSIRHARKPVGNMTAPFSLAITPMKLERLACKRNDGRVKIHQHRGVALQPGLEPHMPAASTAAAITYLGRSYERPRRVRWWYQADRAWCLRR